MYHTKKNLFDHLKYLFWVRSGSFCTKYQILTITQKKSLETIELTEKKTKKNLKICRLNLNLTAAGFIFIGTLFDIGTFYYSKNVKIFDDDEENTKEKEMTPMNNQGNWHKVM